MESGIVYSGLSSGGGGGSGTFVLKAGDTMTGLLNLSGNALNPLNPVTLQQFSGAINGLDPKQSVDAATDGSLPANTYFNGAGNDGIGATLTKNTNGALPPQDTYSLINGQSLLVKDEGNAVHNGIYLVTSVGSAGSPWVLTRRSDMDTGGQANGAVVIAVLNGFNYANKGFLQYNTNTTIGASNLGFTVYNNNAIVADQVTLDLSGGILSILNGGVSNAQVNVAAGIVYSKLNLTGGIVNSDVNSAAAIAGTKISPNFGTQAVVSTGSGTFGGLTTTNTTGSGYLRLQAQGTQPSTFSSGVQIYSNFTSQLNIENSSGFAAVLNLASLSAARAFTFPNVNGIFGLVPSTGFVKSNGSVLSSSASISLATDITGVLPLANGGTGASSLAAGFITSNGSALSSVIGISLTTDVTGILPEANGGTGTSTSIPSGQIVFGGASSYTSSSGLTFSANQFSVTGSIKANGTAGAGYIDLRVQSSNPATVGTGVQLFSNASNQFSILNTSGFAAAINSIAISADRTYSLQDASHTIANVPSSGFVKSNGATLSAQSGIVLSSDVSGILPIANGGSNNSSFTNKSVIFFDGTKFNEAAGVFTYDSATGIFQAPSVSLTGTAGAGFISLANQTANPSTPGSGIKIYADNSGRFNFLGTAGRPISLDVSLLTTGRTQQFPDASGIFGLVPLPGFVKASGNFLISQAAISLTADVTGILPYANGGQSGSAGSVLIEDFLGNTVNSVFGVASSGTGAGATIVAPTALLGWRPGIGQFVTGSTAAGRASIGQTVSSIAVGNNIASYIYETDLFIPILSTGVDRFIIAAGFTNNLAIGIAANYIGFTYVENVNAGAWVCSTSSASVQTNTNTAVTVAAATWYKLTITVNAAGNSVGFFINGTLVATHTTNIPVGQLLNPAANIIKTLGTNVRALNIDYHKIAVTMATAR